MHQWLRGGGGVMWGGAHWTQQGRTHALRISGLCVGHDVSVLGGEDQRMADGCSPWRARPFMLHPPWRHPEAPGLPPMCPCSPLPFRPEGHTIRLSGVKFGYRPDQSPILRDVSFTVPAGGGVGGWKGEVGQGGPDPPPIVQRTCPCMAGPTAVVLCANLAAYTQCPLHVPPYPPASLAVR